MLLLLLLLLLPGPGSFIEVFKMLPLLTEPSAPGQPSFHLVAPSLPNFGFSQGPSQPGFGLPQYAEVCHKLMLKLGYDTYVTQGGDWGFFITRLMGSQYPAHCLATHVNMVAARPPSLLRSPLLFLRHLLTPYSAFEVRGLQRSRWFDTEGRGYYDVQSTRPATLGFALADSPVALLAWIYEKLHDWTDSYPFTDDEVLTWIAIYQFSRAGPAASVRIYYEALRGQREPTTGAKTSSAYHDYNGAVKFGASLFPADLILPPTSYIRTLGPLGFYRAHDRGGHFAAYEVPELLVDDLRSWFGKGGDAESIARTLGLKL